MKRKGLFITLEGVDGCGKSTQAKLLYNYLRRSGYKCILTREPGGTPFGEDIREILLDPSHKGISPTSETLLFESSRSVLVKDVILPHLEKGYIVISDRFSDATLVYQGFAGGENISFLKELNKYASLGLMPDLTLVLDIDAETGLKRSKCDLKNGAKDRMEKKSLAYHRRVRRGYLKLASLERKRIKVIKVEDSVHDTQKRIRDEVLSIL
ncbi:MAG: dTMP kinase [Candidatus Omnitrophica bacterium]|nr:dTMP kinase [Candidatus Omnitrophota bacterium]